MPIRPSTQQLYKAIRTDFKKMSESGKYRSAHIIEQLAEKYYKSAKTIENIVYRTTPAR